MSAGVIPRNDAVRTGAPSTVIEYRPSTSVTTPTVVPLTTMATPGSGLPRSSRTVPLTVLCCASDRTDVSISMAESAIVLSFVCMVLSEVGVSRDGGSNGSVFAKLRTDAASSFFAPALIVLI